MKGRVLALALAAALVCAACGGRGEQAQGPEGDRLYFLQVDQGLEGATVVFEERPDAQDQTTAAGLARLLLSGPEGEGLTSPFPRGTTLRSCRMEDGVALVDLSEAYGGLSGVDLSLADGCMVLTLCQLEEVEAVYLTVEGRPRPFRDQVLTPADFLLPDGTDQEREVEVLLWFPQGEGLGQEERTIQLAPGDQTAIAALQALLDGPESGALGPVGGEGVKLLGVRREGCVYQVDVSGAWLEGEDPDQSLSAMVRTLTGIDPGAEVVLLVEGQRLEPSEG